MYLNLSDRDFSEALISNNGQDMREAVWDISLQNKPKQYYIKIVDNLISRRKPELALRFLSVSFELFGPEGY